VWCLNKNYLFEIRVDQIVSEKIIIEDTIVKRIDPIISAGLIDHGLSAQAKTPGQDKTVAPFSQVPLAKKATVPTRTLVQKKIVGPFSRYPPAKKPILRPTLDLVLSIEAELAKGESAWATYRSTNRRDAIYFYLTAIFRVVTRWRRLNCALKNSRTALRVQAGAAQMKPEPFGVVIFCTSGSNIADAKTRSKWSRVLRYAARAKPAGLRLTDFVKSQGGINECARKFAQIG
jgi:hypothetical protein